MSDAEKRRRAAFRLPSDRDRFTLAAALLRLVVGQEMGHDPKGVTVDRTCARCGQPHGRPRVPGSGLDVSISHSAERVAVACARRLRVGVDVEYLGRDVDPTALLSLVLNSHEVNGFRARGATERDFRRYWTCKEAVLKATGDGLSVPMPDLTISDPAQPPRLIDFDGRPDLAGRVVIAELQLGPGYVACLAAIGDDPGWDHRVENSSEVGSAWFRVHDAALLLGALD